ncbi:hypothetical protein JL722_10355 [Aureococcus anophagefferens]|nr:hypothetical protein JL722_10355 [Aureococcus anophagefferens]
MMKISTSMDRLLGGRERPRDNYDSIPNENETSQTLDERDSMVVFVNAIIGPGVVALPKLYQVSGWLFPTILLTAGGALAALATVVRCETVALMPGNAEFTKKVEFGAPFREWIGERAYVASHVGFYLAAVSQVVSSVTTVASTTDTALAYAFGRSYQGSKRERNSQLQRLLSRPFSTRSYGVFVFDSWAEPLRLRSWSLDHCGQRASCQPFFTGEDFHGEIVLTLGYALTAAALVPFCLTDIRASLGLQYASAAACLAGLVVFAGHGLLRAATEGFALRAASGSQDKTSGLVLFNLMYGIFISTWLNEKKPDVRASRVVYSTAALSTAFFVVFGLVCGAALEGLDWNALTYFAEKGTPWAVRSAALAFGWLVIASGVPVSCVMATRNLATELDERAALALGAGAPWAVGWLFMSPKAFTLLVSMRPSPPGSAAT